MSQFFPYQFDNRYRFIWSLAGARRAVDGVRLTDDDRLVATYGRFRLDTPIANVASASVTGPYRWWRSVGIRLALSDDGLTFGTSEGPGVCLQFHDRINPVFGLRAHSAATVTVADPDIFANEVSLRIGGSADS